MAFPLKDVRVTVRRGSDGEPTLYPRLMRDRSILPKVDIAIQYFESMLGSERRELDPEALVHFFGDHKLARCMVASLARGYRYRPRTFEEIVKPSSLRRLRRAGIEHPRQLRLKVFDHVNDYGHGFLEPASRVETLARIEVELGLRPGELERLLYLDAEEQMVLSRVGDEPKAPDAVAQYNFNVLESILRHAEAIELVLAEAADAARAIATLCAAVGVDVELDGSRSLLRVRLRGRQDALGSWSRHGRRVVRTLVQVLERARGTSVEGEARIALRHRTVRLRLTGETLAVLGGAPAPDMGWAEDPGWSQAELILAATPTRTAVRSRQAGSSLRRSPDPQAWKAGLIVPDLLIRTGRAASLVCAVRSRAHAERLATIAPNATSGEPTLFVGPAATIPPLVEVGAWTLATPTFDLGAIFELLGASAVPGVCRVA